MLYIIPGNPYHLYKAVTTLESAKLHRAQFKITLESLFETDDEPYEDIPVQMYVSFFLPYEPLLKDRSPYLHGHRMPPLPPMIEFLTKSLEGLAYMHHYQVASVIASKVYDKEPRTELRITELTL